MDYIKQLKNLGACREAIDFCENGGYKTLDEAWQACERGDWLMWYAGKLSGEPKSPSRKKLVFVACQCSTLSSHVPQVEIIPFPAIEIAAYASYAFSVTADIVRKYYPIPPADDNRSGKVIKER